MKDGGKMLSQLIKIIFIINHLIVGTCCSIYILYISNKSKKIMIEWWSIRLLKIFHVKVFANKNLNPFLRKKNYLVVSNHISWLDIFVINSIFPVTFVSKHTVSKWPFIGWLAKATDTIFVDRTKISKIKETTQIIKNYLEVKGSVFIFPEGTSTDGSFVLPFKSNLFQTAIDSKSDVLPIVIQYQHNNEFTSASSYTENTSFIHSVLNLIKLNSIDVKITILSPMKRNINRKLLAKKTYQKINKLIN